MPSRRAARRVQSDSAEATEALGAALAAELGAGEVVVIGGEIGAGKTTFVRGACRALGVSAPVNSPTFAIGQRYPAPVPVSHLDLFRVEDLLAEDPDLLADYLGQETISFIELPPQSGVSLAAIRREVARFATLAVVISLEHAGGDRRIVEID